MIKSFKDKETQKLFMGRRSKAVSQQAAPKARRRMALLDQAESLDELRTPGNKLHGLGGKRAGQWAIDVDRQYRICFRFEDGDARDVEATDYH